jgi:hypothetical protein
MSGKKGGVQKGGKKVKSFFLSAEEEKPISTETMANDLRRNMGMPTAPAYDPLAKSVKAQIIKKDVQEKYDKSKIVLSTREWSQTSDNVWQKGWRRISDAEQREISQIDPYIAAIIATRVSQAAACGYRSESKFDKGCRVVDLKPIKKEDFKSDKEFKAAVDQRNSQQESIMKWVLYP